MYINIDNEKIILDNPTHIYSAKVKGHSVLLISGA